MTEEVEEKVTLAKTVIAAPDKTVKRRARRSQKEIENEMRMRILSELKTELSPVEQAAVAAAAIAAAEPDINKRVSETPNMPPGRVWIVLQESPHIQRGQGQFFGVNGAGFLLKPGRKAYVPQGIVDILEHAVEDIPDVDPDTLQVVGWRSRLRFPYSIVAAPTT